MPWARLDEGYFTHRKVVNLSAHAKLLDLAAIAYSARELTDGDLSTRDLRIIAVEADVDEWEALAGELVESGRWERSGRRYVIHDYLQYNPSREQVQRERELSNRRVAKWRSVKRDGQTTDGDQDATPLEATGNGVTNGITNAITNGVVTGVVHPSPARASEPGTDTGTVSRNRTPDSEPGVARATREGSDFHRDGAANGKVRNPAEPSARDVNGDLAYRIEAIGHELDDDNIASSITRASRFQAACHLDNGAMANAVKDAHRRVRKRIEDANRSPPSSRMAYFLGVLEQTTKERSPA